MMLLLETYAVALIAALLIGIVVSYWAFRGSGPAVRGEIAPEPVEIPAAGPASPSIAMLPEVVPTLAAEVPGLGTAFTIPLAAGSPDDLQMLKGVGAKFAAKLNENGIARFDQLAALTTDEVADLDERMGPFKGRLLRDRVVDQAAFLARGDRAGFEAAFGKLGSGL